MRERGTQPPASIGAWGDAAEGSFDDRAWPLVQVIPNRGDVAIETFKAQISQARRLYQRRQAFGLLIDVRGAPMLPAAHRQALAAQMKADNESYPGYMRGFAVVVGSSVQAGIMTAVLWLYPTPYPVRVFGELELAKQWVRSRIVAPA